MDKSLNKVMLFAFVCASFLAGYVVSVFIELLTNSSGTMARVFASQGLRQGLPLVTGICLFLFLSLSSQVRGWGTEVIAEISKIVWPSRKDTTSMTIAVTIIILMSSLLFFVYDEISLFVVKKIVTFNWHGILEGLGL